MGVEYIPNKRNSKESGPVFKERKRMVEGGQEAKQKALRLGVWPGVKVSKERN